MAMLRYAVSLSLVAILVVGCVHASNNDDFDIGSKAPTFANLPGVDGKKYSSDDFKGKDVLVLCITCNHCPVAAGYEERITDFVKKNAGPDSKVGFVAINVNTSKDDRLEAMVEHAKKQKFNFVYLYDESQKIAKALGASVTPEFYVLNKERKLVYWGSFDDKINGPTKSFVEPAVQSALKGEMPVVTKNRAFGCGVQYNR